MIIFPSAIMGLFLRVSALPNKKFFLYFLSKRVRIELYMFKYSTDKFFYKLKIGYQASNLEASIIKFIKNFVRTLKELLNIIINFIKCLVGLIKGIVR